MNEKITLISNSNNNYTVLKNLIDSICLNDYFAVLKSTDLDKNYLKTIKIEKKNKFKIKDSYSYNFLYSNKIFKIEKKKYIYLKKFNLEYYFFWIINSFLKGLYSDEKKNKFLIEKIFFENYIFNQNKKIDISRLEKKNITEKLLEFFHKNLNSEKIFQEKSQLFLDKIAINSEICLNLIIVFLIKKIIYNQFDEKLKKKINKYFCSKKKFFKKNINNSQPVYSLFCIIYLIEIKKLTKENIKKYYIEYLKSFNDQIINKNRNINLFNHKKELSATLIELWSDMALIKKGRLNTLQFRYNENYFNFKKIFINIYNKELKKQKALSFNQSKTKNISIRFDVDRRVTNEHIKNIKKFKDKYNISKFAFFLKQDTAESYDLLKKNFPKSHYGFHFNNFNIDNLNKIPKKSLNFHSGFESEYFHADSIKKIMTYQPSYIENLNYSSDKANKMLYKNKNTILETKIHFTPNYFPMEGSIKDKDKSFFKNIIFNKSKKIFDYSENIVLGTHTDINPEVWLDILEFLTLKYKINFKLYGM